MRWLNPKDPRGTTTWGTVAMFVFIVALVKSHGAPSEVWPNRCALLRAQLIHKPAFAARATLPELSEPQLIPTSISSIKIQAAHKEAHKGGAHSGVPSLRLSLQGSPDERLTAELYRISDEDLAPLSEQLAIHLETLPSRSELTRQGLKVSPEALTCAPQFASTEQGLALGLLLKGGLLHDAPEGVEGLGFQGEGGWFARWPDEAPVRWRLWTPIQGASGQPEWLLVWTRYVGPRTQPASTSIPAWPGTSALRSALKARELAELSEALLTLSTPLHSGDADALHHAGTLWLRRAARRESDP